MTDEYVGCVGYTAKVEPGSDVMVPRRMSAITTLPQFYFTTLTIEI